MCEKLNGGLEENRETLQENIKRNMSYRKERVERAALWLHEASRDLVVNHQDKLITADKKIDFIEWDDLTDKQKEGKRIQARFLINHMVAF